MAGGSWLYSNGDVSGSNNMAPGTTYYLTGLGDIYGESSYNIARVRVYQGMIVSGLDVQVGYNTIANTTTVIFNKNNGNGNQTVSIPGSATGEFRDTTHSDTLVSGDYFNSLVVTGAGAGGLVIILTHVGYKFTSTANSTIIAASHGTGAYSPFGGRDGTVTETQAQYTIRTATTFTNLAGYADNSAGGSTLYTRIRKNGANGNLVCAVPASASGWYEDIVNSDAMVAGDKMCLYNEAFTNPEVTSSSNHRIMTCQRLGLGAFDPSHLNLCLEGAVNSNSSEASATILVQTSLTFQNLFVMSVANSHNKDLTAMFRKDSGNTTIKTIVTANTTGAFEDTAHTEVVASTDYCNITFSDDGSGTGNALIWQAIEAESPITPAPPLLIQFLRPP